MARGRIVVLTSIAVVAQFVLTFALVEGYLGKYNVSTADCGWGGTCTDDGDGPLLVAGWLGAPVAEVVIAAAVAGIAYGRGRRNVEGHSFRTMVARGAVHGLLWTTGADARCPVVNRPR
ncbi:hypothetical protein FNH05_10870 [Amycolatopsis rhizosphaerae]|uniref:Vitamin K epoxide reductase family protein n=1 Tax=Amycolatopsis rhizosphaerae TaxID=2053003 RepID=A0A558CZ91_9PSEU|nr:hypothetical protein FNH05_10870 [Amycolatopsis rhizosphaerae]